MASKYNVFLLQHYDTSTDFFIAAD